MSLRELRLAGGQAATLRLAHDATTLALGEARVSSWDLAGRPYALARERLTWRRALDGGLLCKGLDEGGARVRGRVAAGEGAAVLAAARDEAAQALAALAPGDAEARARLAAVLAMDAAALRADAARFAQVYGRVGILPPDQYLAAVVHLTEGCSWNACGFCELYRGVGFRVRTPAELERHLSEVKAFFGPALALRRTVFLGAANALCVATPRLLPLLEQVAAAFPVAPAGLAGSARRAWLEATPAGVTGFYSFVDAWTGQRRGAGEWRECARLGLRRVYVGLETGDAALLAALRKAGSPDDAVELVDELHAAGIAAGVIVLIGAGGEAAWESHVRETAAVLERMGLRGGDLLYLSDLIEPAGLAPGVGSLPPERCDDQRRALLRAWRPRDPGDAPKVARYDLREFVY